MLVNIQDLVRETGKDEKLYPGKKFIHKYAQSGDFKSHCVVFDWRSDKLHIELKAGLSGKALDMKDLKNYPICFQAPTFLELTASNEDEEEEGDSARGKSGGGGKKPKVKQEKKSSLSAFGRVTENTIPELAKITKFVVMGKELAKESYAQAFENFKSQLHQAKIMALDIMKNVGNVIKKATPGGGLAAKGDETIKYCYDAERNAGLFGGLNL